MECPDCRKQMVLSDRKPGIFAYYFGEVRSIQECRPCRTFRVYGTATLPKGEATHERRRTP